jgi:hypothetical protein
VDGTTKCPETGQRLYGPKGIIRMRYLMTIKNRVMIEWWYATWFSNARKLGHFGGLVSTRMHEGLATGDKGKERN